LGNNAFQETDAVSMLKPITVSAATLRKAGDAPEVKRAFAMAKKRAGPAFVEACVDVLSREAPQKEKREQIVENRRWAQIQQAAELIDQADRPLIICGEGAMKSGAWGDTAAMAEKIGAPILKQGKETEAGNRDLVIIVGCKATKQLASMLWKARRSIQVDVSYLKRILGVSVFLQGDARTTMRLLCDSVKSRDFAEAAPQKGREKGINPIAAMKCLNNALEEKDIVTTGVGQARLFAISYIRTKRGGKFITSRGFGTMGFGLPSAMGAKAGRPDSNVFNIDGDASFLMNIQELDTCVKEGLNTINLVFNNSSMGIMKQASLLQGKKVSASLELGEPPDYVRIAGGFGAKGFRVKTTRELGSVLRAAKTANQPVVIDMVVDTRVTTPYANK